MRERIVDGRFCVAVDVDRTVVVAKEVPFDLVFADRPDHVCACERVTRGVAVGEVGGATLERTQHVERRPGVTEHADGVADGADSGLFILRVVTAALCRHPQDRVAGVAVDHGEHPTLEAVDRDELRPRQA